jgi:hypothetical protein
LRRTWSSVLPGSVRHHGAFFTHSGGSRVQIEPYDEFRTCKARRLILSEWAANSSGDEARHARCT